ncbi:MAG: hypothetical protein JWP91_339, partial [Fibrobacteres bacterium]|nr:hypothetical protein [Fibrobacterota bacterium]
MPRESFGFGLLRRREVVVPSLRGSILLAGIFLAVGWVFLKGVQPFLAVNRPIVGDILFVEGWI